MFLDFAVGRLVEPLTGKEWSRSDTLRRLAARRGQYRARGLRRGDRVFIHFGNTAEFLIEVLAVWSAGGCVVPIDPRFTPFEIQTLAQWAHPRLSIWDQAVDSDLAASLARLGVEPVDLSSLDPDAVTEQALKGGQGNALQLDQDALVLFTSGTTGQPKGVVHTHRSLRARWMSLRHCLGLESFQRSLCLLPTHFGHGLICNCLFPWLSGQDLYLLPPFKPDLLAQLGSIVDEHRITFLSSVPSVWRLALRITPPPKGGTLERIFIGSAPLSAALWQGVREWSGTARVLNAYGITETGSWLAGTTLPDFRPEDGLVGVPWGGILKVLRNGTPEILFDPDAECATGEPGQVWVQTPALMRGYLDRDDLTEQVVSMGWFATGDIGLLDDRGWLYLRGREREEINKGGMKVHPADIDAVVERFPATAEVCCFGYADTLLGEDVGIAVVLLARDQDTLRALFAWARLHLARHQMPQRWYLVEEIPRTSRGKVNRASVAQRCSTLVPIDAPQPG